ncbi:MAG: hypothetical protein JWO30_4351 [Fibrobacteres bacterium]|nr:hypothetical protein [Fibrobacterota bacterium]
MIPSRKKPPAKSFSGKTDHSVLSIYSKKIALVMVLLAVAAGLVSSRIEGYPVAFATGAVVFMALNALAAIYPLYRFRGKMNPFNVYVAGMVVRMAIIGMVLIAVILAGGLSQSALLAVTLTAMVSFVAYLAVEIHHFLRHNASLMSPT